MDWSDWIALGSAVIALIALGYSLVGYYKYDRPIKSLQKEKLQQEALEKKKAKFEVSYFTVLIHNMFQIQNVGNVIAKNIQISIVDDKQNQIAFQDGKLLHQIPQLEPTEKSKTVALRCDYQNRLKVKVTWDDDSGNGYSRNFFVDRRD